MAVSDKSSFLLKTDDFRGPRHSTEERYNLFYRRTLIGDYEGLQLETELAEILRQSGIPIPNGVFVRYQGMGHQVWNKVPGVTLDMLPESERTAAYCDLARILRILHSVLGRRAGLIEKTSPIAGYHPTWAEYIAAKAHDNIAYLSDNQLVTKDSADQIAAILGRFCENESKINRYVSVLHGDLNDKNVLWHNGQISGIIDWEDALVGDPVFELASWATFIRPGWTEDWISFFRAYYGEDADKIVSETDWENRFWTYYLRVSISKLVYLHKAKYTDLTLGQFRVAKGQTMLKKIQ